MGQVTISRELLRQAIELLEGAITYDWHGNPSEDFDRECDTAATVLSATLEQPAVEPDAIGCKCSVCGEWQRWTPSGMVCKNGHGGVPGVNQRLYTAPQAQQPPRIGSGVTVEQTLEQWEHDFNNPMTPEQQADWVKREREFASALAQQPRKAVKLTTDEYTALAHRIASKYTHRSDPAFTGYTFLPHTLEQFVRAIEQAVWEKLGVTE